MIGNAYACPARLPPKQASQRRRLTASSYERACCVCYLTGFAAPPSSKINQNKFRPTATSSGVPVRFFFFSRAAFWQRHRGSRRGFLPPGHHIPPTGVPIRFPFSPGGSFSSDPQDTFATGRRPSRGGASSWRSLRMHRPLYDPAKAPNESEASPARRGKITKHAVHAAVLPTFVASLLEATEAEEKLIDELCAAVLRGDWNSAKEKATALGRRHAGPTASDTLNASYCSVE